MADMWQPSVIWTQEGRQDLDGHCRFQGDAAVHSGDDDLVQLFTRRIQRLQIRPLPDEGQNMRFGVQRQADQIVRQALSMVGSWAADTCWATHGLLLSCPRHCKGLVIQTLEVEVVVRVR